MSKLFQFIIRNINFKMGFIGALGLGGFVYWLNRSYGFETAIVPALKQFMYTFLVGGSLVRLSENLSIAYSKKGLSIFIAVFVTTAITGTLISFIHLLKGTPNPLYTIFWTTLTAPPGFLLVAVLRRKKYDREQLNKERA